MKASFLGANTTHSQKIPCLPPPTVHSSLNQPTMADADADADEKEAIAEQRAELLKARTLESDLDLAFRFQLEEAMAASLSLLPSSSSSSSSSSSPPKPINGDGDALNVADVHCEELDKLEQEHKDRDLCRLEMKRFRDDFFRQIHDQKVAVDIQRMPDDDWEDFGDEFERPFGEGSSSASSSNVNFRLYFKGLVSVERVGGSDVTLTGIGVAICDPKDNMIFQLSKPLVGNGSSRRIAEIKALIEGLETAVALDLKHITFFCDYPPVFQYARYIWKPKGRKVVMLMEKVKLLRKKFNYCRPFLVARYDMKLAFKLARDAIVSQMSKPLESNAWTIKETCVICLEETDEEKMFTVDGCLHKYCFCCMRQHVEAKLYIGMIPKCPHENCKSELNVNNCENFLTPKLTEIMKQRIREASIPVAEKVYCAYPKCSALMSEPEVFDFSRKENVRDIRFGARKCVECHGLFCVNCKVPWHTKLTCAAYRRSNPYPRPEDTELKNLATRSMWRQCAKCNHMIELAEGCFHMTCRCGHQFCYTCGLEYRKQQATCSCPLWDEENILLEDSDFDEEDEEDDDEYFDDSFSDSESDWIF